MKKLLSIILFAFIAMALFACPQPQRGVPQEPTDTEYCGIACTHLLSLEGRDGNPGCEEARVLELPDGDILTCEQFCIDTQKRGRSLCPSKWMEAKECEDVEELRLQCEAEKK